MDKLKLYARAVQMWVKEHPIFSAYVVCFSVGLVCGLVL